MPINDRQRAQRKNKIGSSDAPAILGVDGYRNAYDVYLSKTQDLAEIDDNMAITIGNALEKSILDWAAGELKVSIRKNCYRASGDGINAANLDATIPAFDDAVLEGKTSGIMHPTPEKELWGESGTIQVPDRVTVQVHHQMYCCGANRAFVAALIGGLGLRLYEIARNDDLIDILVEQINDFWINHVLARIPPPAEFYPSMDVIKRIRRVPEKVVALDDVWLCADCLRQVSHAPLLGDDGKIMTCPCSGEIIRDYTATRVVERWQRINRARLKLEKMTEGAKAAAVALLGDAEAGLLPDGRLLTFEETTRKAYSVAEKTYRTARIRKAPKQITGG